MFSIISALKQAAVAMHVGGVGTVQCYWCQEFDTFAKLCAVVWASDQVVLGRQQRHSAGSGAGKASEEQSNGVLSPDSSCSPLADLLRGGRHHMACSS
ncbi:hypothetical protein SRHO_G00160880 [Serrasalmus rhombeus]